MLPRFGTAAATPDPPRQLGGFFCFQDSLQEATCLPAKAVREP